MGGDGKVFPVSTRVEPVEDEDDEPSPTGPDDCSGPDPYNAHIDDMAERRGE